MTNSFLCPHCNGYLNVADNIIFAVESEDGRKGLILLHSELGNYQVRTNPNFSVEQGKKYEFYCPVCHAELASDVNKNLSRVLMVDAKNNEYEVLFSKIAGEKSTYTIIGESVNMYGEDYGNYVDFINLSSVK
jgi:transcription initiation factor IIE alpha subunit